MLFILVPMEPQNRLRMPPFEFMMTPPYLAGPGFPLVTLSTLSLKDPGGGAFQNSGIETCTGRERAIELSGGISSNPKACKILHSFLSATNSS